MKDIISMSYKKYFFIVITSILFLQGCVEQKLRDDACEPQIMVVAHRGAHNHFPENSIPAIREAIEIGVDLVEIDIRHTKDNYMVLMHDKTIDRTTNGTGLVEDFTLQELKNFRLKKNDSTLTDEQIPTLQEVFELFDDTAYFDLDVKTPKYMDVVEMVEEYNLFHSCIFLIYDLERAIQLKERDKRFRTLIRATDEESVKAIPESLETEAIHIDNTTNSVTINTRIKELGARSFINSLGDIDKEALSNNNAFEKLYQNGANMIQTDQPELLLRHLRSKKLHW